jgi:hypothetical protein
LEDGSTTNKSEEEADILNTYFANIREIIASSVMNQFDSSSNKHFSLHLPFPQCNSIFLEPTSQFEITKIFCDLNPGNSVGIDWSSFKIVEEILSATILPLHIIFHLKLEFPPIYLKKWG